MVKGRKGRWEGKEHGEKKYSDQSRHRGWQMLGKTCRKICPFRLTGVENPHIGVRKIVSYWHAPETKNPIPQKEICRGPLAELVLPFLVWEINKERAAEPPSNPTHLLWMAGDSVA